MTYALAINFKFSNIIIKSSFTFCDGVAHVDLLLTGKIAKEGSEEKGILMNTIF